MTSHPLVLSLLIALAIIYLVISFLRLRVQIKQHEFSQKRAKETDERTQQSHAKVEDARAWSEQTKAQGEKFQERNEALFLKSEKSTERWSQAITRVEALLDRIERRNDA